MYTCGELLDDMDSIGHTSSSKYAETPEFPTYRQRSRKIKIVASKDCMVDNYHAHHEYKKHSCKSSAVSFHENDASGTLLLECHMNHE